MEILEPPTLPDVLTEQFAYLLFHSVVCEGGECPDCRRFAEVQVLLLVRFQS
jgi:hypothetical protein